MAWMPSLRAVLPSELHEPSRAALRTRQEDAASLPWFVRVLAGGGAWVAALFLVCFLGLFLLDEKGWARVVTGLVIVAAALMMRRASGQIFLAQFALSLGLAGQAYFLVGVSELFHHHEDAFVALAAVVLQSVLLFIYPDALQRFLSALFASLSLMYLLRETTPPVVMDVALMLLTALAHVLLLKRGALQGRAWGEVVTPTAFGLVTTLFGVLSMRAWFYDVYVSMSYGEGRALPSGVLTLGLAAVTLYSAWRVMEETRANPSGPAGVTAFAALSLLAVLTLNTPGVIAALGILMLGFHRRSAVLLGMAVVFVLVFGSNYYYDMTLSLLAKSLALLGGGLLMLGLRLFIARRFPVAGEGS